MTWPERRIGSWSELLKVFEEIIESNERRFCFRGQSDAKWSLEPTLTRMIKDYDDHTYEFIEENILSMFQDNAKLHIPFPLPSDDDTLSWWSIMQHYKAPTRLLDWSYSPYVALYFAVTENMHKNGAVWAFNPEVPFDSCPPNEHKVSLLNFLHLIAKHESIIVRCVLTPDKQSIQQGLFSCCSKLTSDHANVLHKLFRSKNRNDYYKIIIPSNLKLEFLHQLNIANVSASSLFPGISGLGLSITQEVLLKIRSHTRLSCK